MKHLVCISFLIFSCVLFAQDKPNTQTRDTLLEGKASLFGFSHKVYFVLETSGDSIQGISFEEDIDESNPVVGKINFSDIGEILSENKLIFNSERIINILNIYVEPNFNASSGGLLFLLRLSISNRSS